MPKTFDEETLQYFKRTIPGFAKSPRYLQEMAMTGGGPTRTESMPRRSGMQNLSLLLGGGNDSPFAWGNEFNESIPSGPRNFEQAREAGVLSGMDARTNASLASDLEEANAVRQARDMGFGGSFPLREQSEAAAMAKLRQILLPKQIEAETARLENEAEGRRAQANRDAAMERFMAGEAGRNTRAEAGRASAERMAAKYRRPVNEPSWLASLFGGEEEAPEMEAEASPAPTEIKSVRQVR